MLKYLFISAVALLILPLTLTQASGAESGWLYNPQAGVIWRVDANGAVAAAHLLPAPIEGSYSPQIEASEDGQLIGYTVTAANGERRVVVFDAVDAQIELEYTPEAGIAVDSFSAPADGQPFSDDLRYFAYGYSRTSGGWRILLIDVNSGNVVSAIGEGSARGLPPVGNPVVEAVSEQRVEFHVHEATGDTSSQEYAWMPTSNVVAPQGVRYDDAAVQPTATLQAVQVTPMPTVSVGVLAGSSLENSGFDPNLLINVGNSARQPVGEGTPNAVVTLPPPSR